MDLNSVNSLNQKGNDASKLGNLAEALHCYTEAIEMLGPDGDNKTAAAILSNRAQLYLKMEMYQQALEDADKSLQYDSTFRKSTLRRAMANTELGNNSEAMEDLRKILTLEPGNTTVRSWMKRVSEPVKMDSQLREAYGGHFFRRWMTDRRRMALEPPDDCKYIKVPILRQSFLSVENSVFMRKVLSDSTVASGSPGVMLIWLSCWLVSKRMRVDVQSSLICPVSYAALSTLYCVVQPIIKLIIAPDDDELDRQFGFMHKCETVYHLDEFHFHPPNTDPSDIQAIEEASSIVTRLPYFAEVVKFKDKTFPMVDTLVIAPSPQIVDMEFLKLWKRQQWGIKDIITVDGAPNLLNFELFEGIISNHVNHVWMSLSMSNPDVFRAKNQVKQFKDNMQTLKHVFPMLDSITVYLSVACQRRGFPGISHAVKRWIFYLADKFVHHLKPDWCREFKVLMEFTGEFELGAQPVSISLQPLKDLVKECRGEIKQLKYIRLRGPTPLRIGGFTGNYFATIEMATDDTEFQIVFHDFSSSRPQNHLKKFLHCGLPVIL